MANYSNEKKIDKIRDNPVMIRKLMGEASEAFLSGKTDKGRSLIRDCINASIGYVALADMINGTTDKSLHRMFGKNGNPSLNNWTAVMLALQEHNKIMLSVTAKKATS